jgi:hypothetical protein
MNANTAATNTGMAKPVLGVVIFILVIVGLYYLYNFLYGKNASYGQVSILSQATSATKTVTDPNTGNTAVAATEISGILDGGQYTASVWFYVADTKGFAKQPTPLAHLLEISDNRFVAKGSNKTPGNTLIFVGLNPLNGTLVVRQSTGDNTYKISNNMTTGFSSTKYPLQTLIDNYNTGSTYTQDDRCDIINGIEFQRWIMVTVVGNGRTLDVYVDGKLARSCVYKSNFALGSTDGKGVGYVGLNNGGNLKGYFANTTYNNYALTPDAIWSQYQAGPTGYFSLGSFFTNLFNVNVSFGTTAGLDDTTTK